MSAIYSAALLGRLRSDDKGGIAIMTALMMPVLVGGMALGAETGALYMKQRKIQHAGDMAAFAGAVRLMQGDSEAELTPAARHVANTSGYTGTDAGFIINIPPKAGGYLGDPEAVEVILSEQRPRLLTALFGDTAFTLGGRAVAKYSWDPASGSQACIVALSQTAQTAVKALGNSSTNVGVCDIASNSGASNSVNVDNVNANCIYSAGEGTATNSTIGCGGVQTDSRAVRDPYAGKDLPPMDPSCERNWNQVPPPSWKAPTAGAYYPYEHPSGCSYTVFTNKVTFKDKITLQTGYYVFKDDFTIFPAAPPNHTVIDGTSGVTLVFMGGNINTSGNAILNLVAPTSGATTGLVLWSPVQNTSLASVAFNAGGSSTYTGAIYMPNVNLTMNGGSSNTSLAGGGCTQIIASTVTITGGGTYNATGAGCACTGTEPVKTGETVALAE